MAVAIVDVRVDSSAAVSNLKRLDQASKNSQGSLDALARKATGLGAALAGGFAVDRIIRDVTELDRNLRRLGTVGGDVAALDKGLGQLSKNLEGIASKAELAAASYQALSAGFTETGANLKLVEAASKAAIGGLADTTQVTEVLTKTLNAYGLSGNQAIKVTDSISKAIEYGQVEWADYTSQLGRVASIAAIAGVSIDEVNAFIASATKNGATAEIAFTGLGATLNTLLQPTKESQEAAKLLGIQWNIAGLNAKGFDGLIAELAQKMGTNKEAAVRLLGSQEAMRGAFAAASKNGKDYAAALTSIQDATGKTNSDFQKMKESLENQLKGLDTAFKNLSEALGKAFGPAVVDIISDLTSAVNGFADVINMIPQPVATAIADIAKLVIQATLLKKAFEGIIALRTGFIAATTAMATSTAMTGAAANTTANSFNLYSNNAKTLAAQSAAASAKITPLGNALRSIGMMGVITVAVNIAVTGLSQVIQANAELNRLRQRRAAGGAAAVFAGSTKEEVIRQQGIARKTKEFEQRKLEQLTSPTARTAQFLNVGGILGAGRLLGLPSVPTIGEAGQQERISRATIKEAEAVLGLDPSAFPSALPSGGGGGGGGGGAGTGAKPDKAAEAAAKRIAEQIAAAKSLLNLSQRQFEIEGQILIARSQGNDALVTTRTAQKELASITSEIADTRADKELPDAAKLAKIAELEIKAKGVSRQLAFDLATAEKDKAKNAADAMQKLMDEQALMQARLNGNEAEVLLNQQIRDLKAQYPGLNEADVRTTLEKTNALKQQVNAATQLKQLYTDIGMSIKDGVVGAIQGAIDGTKSLQEVANNLLSSIANKLLDVAVNFALFGAMSGTGTGGGLLGGLFKRANGGSVMAGQGYLVGERGPELFMPGRSGGIAPAGGFGGVGNVVVNVDAGGSSVQGDPGQANQLGKVIGLAVQQELIKQKRPGGLLA